MACWWMIALLAWLGVARSGALSILSLEGPNQAARGSDVVLHCVFDLEGDVLYAVKWFKGQREFFQFVPNNVPSCRKFPVPFIAVDVAVSNVNRVVLRKVQPKASGLYRFEVSAEGPSFATDYREFNLTVLDTPLGDPVIENVLLQYAVGDFFRVNCTSFEARPAAQLQWFMNGENVSEQFLRRYPVRLSMGEKPLETSTLGLEMRLSEEHFKKGIISLICTASVGTVYRKSTTLKIEERASRDAIATALRPSDPVAKRRSIAHSEANQLQDMRNIKTTLIWCFITQYYFVLTAYQRLFQLL